jgi:hypothetical protein
MGLIAIVSLDMAAIWDLVLSASEVTMVSAQERTACQTLKLTLTGG